MSFSTPTSIDTEITRNVSPFADPLTTPKATISRPVEIPLDGVLEPTMSVPSSAAVSSAVNVPSARTIPINTLVDSQNTIPEGFVPSSLPALSTYPSPSLTPLRSAWPDRNLSDRMSERSPSPHTRLPLPSAMAEALGASKNPGLIRRMSRGAQHRLRRRASTTQSMRMRDQSAGPVLMRRRSDSNGTSDYAQDMSDLELDSAAEDAAEEPTFPYALHNPNNGLGISVGRPSNDTTRFEGGQAPADPAILQKGTVLIKLTKRKRKTLKFWLDSNSARVCWHLTNPLKSFFIDDVTRVEAGVESRHARDDIQVSPEDEHLILTIVYNVPERSKGRNIKTMHLLMPDLSIMTLWRNALNSVVRERVTKMNALSPSTEKSEKSMAVLWQQAMVGRSEQLFTLDDARKLCRTLQINCSDSTVGSHFQEADTDGIGKLDYSHYRDFVNSFKRRTDISHLYRNLRHGTDLDLSVDDFFSFLKDEQGVNIDKERLQWESVFEKFSKPVQALSGMSDPVPTVRQRTMNTKGFQNFLTSSYNSPLITSKTEVTLDRPLNEYFISSSHNTYLLGRQVAGESSVEGYICALIKGCRCVEIDCWDGDNGRPVVTHGRTMTTKILFEDCVSVIAKYAFHSSPYPLVISLEVHCNPEQQSTMVDIMNKHWATMMIAEPIMTDSSTLPSPEELKYKILIKVKLAEEAADHSQPLPELSHGRSRARSLGSTAVRSPSADRHPFLPSPLVSSPVAISPSEPPNYAASTPRGSTTSGPTMSPSSSADDSDGMPASAEKLRKRKPKTSKTIPKLSKLGVYAQGLKFGRPADLLNKSYNHVFSVQEAQFDKLCKKNSSDTKTIVEVHNVRHLMRVYPSARRLDSSNFNPLHTWRRGVQMAALNWQTYDLHQQVNEAMFAAGSDSLGYVLKPMELRHAKHVPIADTIVEPRVNNDNQKKDKSNKKAVRFAVDILSAQRLPRPWNQNTDAGMNPYIEFEMFCAEDKAPGVPSDEVESDAPAGRKKEPEPRPILRKRTKIVAGNGFDPNFNETIHMTAKTKFPGMVFARWTVWNSLDPHRLSSNVLLGSFTAKLGSLQQGYRQLPLFNPQGEQYQDAKLFVMIRKQAAIPLPQLDGPSAEPSASPYLEPIRADRSWPRRIFSRNPSQARRPERYNSDSQTGLLSRTSSLDRHSTTHSNL